MRPRNRRTFGDAPAVPLAVLVLVILIAGCGTQPKVGSTIGGSQATTGPATTVSPAGGGSEIAGLDWSKPQSVDSEGLVAISCPATDYCIATDQAGNSLTYDGTGWSKPNPIGASGVAPGVPGASSGVAPGVAPVSRKVSR